MSCSGFITVSTCSLVQVHCLTGDKLIAGTDSPKNLSELVHAVAEVFEYGLQIYPISHVRKI